MEESLRPMEFNVACEARKPTVREVLEGKRRTLTAQLCDVNAAIEALDAAPEVSKVLELLARAGARL